MTTDPSPRPTYTIAAVSRLTGVSCHSLRAWERRYGFPLPVRTGMGHRRYDVGQVERLLEAVQELRRGRAAGEVMREIGRPAAVTAASPCPDLVVRQMIDRLAQGDIPGAEWHFAELARTRDSWALAEHVIAPALVETGERWYRGSCEIYQERCISGFLRRKLALLIEQAQQKNAAPARQALVGTLEGELHEGGVLLVSLLLELSGWRALSLGTGLPAREYQKAIDRWRPEAVCISFALARSISKRFEELSSLRGAPVFVGGRSILNHRGLACRLGLIPLTGSASGAVETLVTMAREPARQPGVPPSKSRAR